MAGLSLGDLIKSGQLLSYGALDPFFQQIGVNNWQDENGGNQYNGGPSFTNTPSQQALQQANGYTFQFVPDGSDRGGHLVAFDSGGQQVGAYRQTPYESLASGLAGWAGLAAAGFGGLGALGIGPLGGLLGGAGGAAGASGGAPAIGNGAFLGETVAGGAPAIGNGAFLGEGAAGAAGLGGAGTITGGAGLTAPGLAGGSGLGAGLGTVGAGGGGALGAAGAGGAGSAGFWGTALKFGAPVLGSIAGGLIQSNAAGKAAGAQTAAAQAAAAAVQKALAPYQQAGTAAIGGQQDLLGLNGADKQAAAIAAIQGSPAFTSQQKLGENRILANASATGGLRGGNVQAALAQFSPALLSQLIDQQYSRLGGLTTTGANAAAGVGSAQANAQTQIGAAQAGQALANGNALQGVFSSGFGALGNYLGQQTPMLQLGGKF